MPSPSFVRRSGWPRSGEPAVASMVTAALTGGIATGKSFCLARFADLHVPVIDADILAREAVAPGSLGLAEVVRRFGNGMRQPDGSLNRPALARLVFEDPAARAELESIVHPHVYLRISTWLAGLPSAPGVAVADIPLLFETGHVRDFGRVVVCWCESSEQLRRVMSRDGLDVKQAQARIAAQWPLAEKVRRADYAIDTGGTFADTERQVLEVLRQLGGEAGSRKREAGSDKPTS